MNSDEYEINELPLKNDKVYDMIESMFLLISLLSDLASMDENTKQTKTKMQWPRNPESLKENPPKINKNKDELN